MNMSFLIASAMSRKARRAALALSSTASEVSTGAAAGLAIAAVVTWVAADRVKRRLTQR